MDSSNVEQIQNSCTRFLTGHARLTPRQILTELAEFTESDARADLYGQGRLITDFENEVAQLLGKEAAVFMPSGTMAQQIALRLWADRRHTPHLAFHPTCHLEIHEQKGYQLLHGLHGVLVGSPDRLLTLDDLQKVSESLAAVLLELPQREIGGQLPAWAELLALTAWARERHIPLHMDGARLWECQPFYGCEYREIAALFDTVYVSFYKGLGGIAGAMLLGPADLMAEARVWQRRHGGNLVRLFPYVLSAKQGLATRLSRMPAYHAKALEVAQVLSTFPQIEVVPNPPHTHMLHVFIRGDKSRLESAALAVSQATGVWLFHPLRPARLPAYHMFEFSVGDATLELTASEIADLFGAVFNRANAA